MAQKTDAETVAQAIENQVPGATAWEVSEDYHETVGCVGVNLHGDSRDQFGKLMGALRSLGYDSDHWHANRFKRTDDIDLFIEEL